MTRGSRAGATIAAALVGLLPVLSACQVGPAQPGPAVPRSGPPPWDAPRDAVSYIERAGFERLPLDFNGPAPYTVRMAVTVDGKPVEIPAGIGVDRIRAEQAAVHTHSTDGVVYVEAKTTAERPTLEQFFQLWGVRYDATCLGAACSGVRVQVNHRPAPWNTTLPRDATVQITAHS